MVVPSTPVGQAPGRRLRAAMGRVMREAQCKDAAPGNRCARDGGAGDLRAAGDGWRRGFRRVRLLACSCVASLVGGERCS